MQELFGLKIATPTLKIKCGFPRLDEAINPTTLFLIRFYVYVYGKLHSNTDFTQHVVFCHYLTQTYSNHLLGGGLNATKSTF